MKKQHCIARGRERWKPISGFSFFLSGKILVLSRNKIFIKEKWMTKSSSTFTWRLKGLKENMQTHTRSVYSIIQREKKEKKIREGKNDGNKIFIRISFEFRLWNFWDAIQTRVRFIVINNWMILEKKTVKEKRRRKKNGKHPPLSRPPFAATNNTCFPINFSVISIMIEWLLQKQIKRIKQKFIDFHSNTTCNRILRAFIRI